MTKSRKAKLGKPRKKKNDNELPYSLYQVLVADENKHADTVFLRCSNNRYFAVHSSGYCDSGELVLAEWAENSLGALYRVNEVSKEKVVLGQCIKNQPGFGSKKSVPMSEVIDHR